MKPILETITRDFGEQNMPQAVNCIDFFRRKFFNSFSDDLNKRIWIAGGSVRSYFSDGRITTDVDFFCVDRKTMAELARELRKKYGYKAYIITKNCIKGYAIIKGDKIDIDIVKKEFTNPINCIDNFDFTVCCFAVNSDNFYYHISSIFDLIRKRLVVHKLPAPVDSLKRMSKYIKKGFTACNGTILTIAKEISKQDTNNEDLFSFYKFD